MPSPLWQRAVPACLAQMRRLPNVAQPISLLALGTSVLASTGFLSPTWATASAIAFVFLLLTALTTFLGLGPMIFETSLQALFLVPMAIALGMGTLVSAVVVLSLIPALMVIAEELGLETLSERLRVEGAVAGSVG